MRRLAALTLVLFALATLSTSAGDKDNTPPRGFRALFNGKDLTGWQGMVPVNQREKMSKEEYAAAVKKASDKILPHWKVKEGVLVRDVVKGGRAQWVYINPGRSNGRETEVLPDSSSNQIPVAVGDTVLIEGHLTLTHDAPVRVVMPSEGTAEGSR